MPVAYGRKTETVAERQRKIANIRKNIEVYSDKRGRNLGIVDPFAVPLDDPNWKYRWVDFKSERMMPRNVERSHVWQMEVCDAEEMIKKYEKDFRFSEFKDGSKIIKLGLTLCRFPRHAAEVRTEKLALQALDTVEVNIKEFEKDAGNNLRGDVQHVSSVEKISTKRRAVTVQQRPTGIKIESGRGTIASGDATDRDTGEEDDE